MNIGNIIKNLRKEQNVTQEELANALNISAQSISKWEKNQANPDITYIPLLADFFHVSVETLFLSSDENINLQYENVQNQANELAKSEEIDAIISLWENMFFRYPNDYRILKELLMAISKKRDKLSFEKFFRYLVILLKKNENKDIENEILDCLKEYIFNEEKEPEYNKEEFLNQNQIDNVFKVVKKQKLLGRRIMLVDDAPFMRKMQREMLEDAGFEIVGEAVNGNQAVEQYKQLSPDIIILDIVMPELDGISAARKIKSINSDACIVICSAFSKLEIVEDAKALDVNYFITKPFQSTKLVSVVKELY